MATPAASSGSGLAPGWWVAIVVAVITAIGVIVAAIINHNSSSKNPPPPSASNSAFPPCGESDLGVDIQPPGPLSVHTVTTLTAHVRCTLAGGDHLVWLVTRDGMGSPTPHTNYYGQGELTGSTEPQELPIDLSSADVGSVRTYSLVKMDDAAWRQFNDARAKRTDHSVLSQEMPKGYRRVSQLVQVTRD
ncbi:hypothetical protein [Kitasatospora cinereorecta]|uniref:hypothetical protein n=1 Tax=Kitasatospora cinereorecta TaxID=285560 RepID=UPI003376E5CA